MLKLTKWAKRAIMRGKLETLATNDDDDSIHVLLDSFEITRIANNRFEVRLKRGGDIIFESDYPLVCGVDETMVMSGGEFSIGVEYQWVGEEK